MGAVGVQFDNPDYLGGEQGRAIPDFLGAGEGERPNGADLRPAGIADYYQKWQGASPYQRQVDPYMEAWKQQAKQRALADRAEQMKLMGVLRAQAQGGSTPQQEQQARDFQMAQQNAAQVAQSQGGGGYGRSAAMGSLMGTTAVQGAQQNQQAAQLRASDMMSAQRQMLQVASQQRAQDLMAQGMTAEDAQRQAQLEAQARGMNYQSQLGYAQLEQQQGQSNQQAYLDSIRRGYRAATLKQQQQQAGENAGMQAGMAAMSMGMGFI